MIHANKAEGIQRLKVKYQGGKRVMVFAKKQPLSEDL